MATDPVCGMSVNEATALRAERDGEASYFCSDHCRRSFLAAKTEGTEHHSDKPSPISVPAAGSEAIYTCPMHPQIEQVGPGTCPIRGMALEPKTVQRGETDDPELSDMTRRFRVAVLLTVPLLLLAMLPMVGVPVGEWLGGIYPWMQLLLSTPVVLWAAWPFFDRGWRSVVTRNLNMFTLIALGVGAAYVYSLVAVLAPGLFPEPLERQGAVHQLRLGVGDAIRGKRTS